MVQATYRLKAIEFGQSRRKVKVVMQNENGPCPLLAVANVLLLRNVISLPASAPDVTQERLISLVAGHLLDSNSEERLQATTPEYRANVRQNVADVIALLPKLATGVDVNVRFHAVHAFEYTDEVAIFPLLDIDLVHGWLVDPQDPAAAALAQRSYNEVLTHLVTVLGDEPALRALTPASSAASPRAAAAAAAVAAAAEPAPAGTMHPAQATPPEAGPGQALAGEGRPRDAAAAPAASVEAEGHGRRGGSEGEGVAEQTRSELGSREGARPGPAGAGDHEEAEALAAALALSLADAQNPALPYPGAAPSTAARAGTPGGLADAAPGAGGSGASGVRWASEGAARPVRTGPLIGGGGDPEQAGQAAQEHAGQRDASRVGRSSKGAAEPQPASAAAARGDVPGQVAEAAAAPGAAGVLTVQSLAAHDRQALIPGAPAGREPRARETPAEALQRLEAASLAQLGAPAAPGGRETLSQTSHLSQNPSNPDFAGSVVSGLGGASTAGATFGSVAPLGEEGSVEGFGAPSVEGGPPSVEGGEAHSAGGVTPGSPTASSVAGSSLCLPALTAAGARHEGQGSPECALLSANAATAAGAAHEGRAAAESHSASRSAEAAAGFAPAGGGLQPAAQHASFGCAGGEGLREGAGAAGASTSIVAGGAPRGSSGAAGVGLSRERAGAADAPPDPGAGARASAAAGEAKSGAPREGAQAGGSAQARATPAPGPGPGAERARGPAALSACGGGAAGEPAEGTPGGDSAERAAAVREARRIQAFLERSGSQLTEHGLVQLHQARTCPYLHMP